jgi:general secretion pathway protein M
MNRQAAKVAALQFLSMLLILLPLFIAGAYVWHKHQWANSVIAEIEPRHARLQGLGSLKQELEIALKQTQAALAKHVYPASLDATKAGNDAQQRIRKVFADSQLLIESVQVLAAKDVEGFQRIGVVLRIEGSLPNIHEALVRLGDQNPTILLDSVYIQNLGPMKPSSPQRLMGNFSFSVLRAKT